MARPKLEPGAARSIVYGVRLREQEAAALRRIADLVDQPLSRLLRRLIREAVTGGPDFFDDDKIELRRLSREMNAIGRNLNMLVRAIHRGEHVAPDDLRRVINAARAQLAIVQDTYQNAVRAACHRAIVPLCEEAGLSSPFDLQEADFVPARPPARRRGRPRQRATPDPALAPLAVGPSRSPSPVRTARVGGRGRP